MKRLAQFLGCIAMVLSAALPAPAQEAAPPNVIDDQAETDGKTIHIHVLQNDSAPSGNLDPSTLRIVSGPSRGQAVVIAQGSPKIKYTATGTGAGADSFRYEICDLAGLCAAATVTVNILLGATSTTSTSTTTTTSTTTSTTLPPTGSAESPSDGSDSAGTTPATVESTTSTVPSTDDPAPSVHPLGEMMLGSHEVIVAAGTTIGEPRGIQFEEDIRYLGRSGRDTLKLIAVPTLMVSGIVGFLMIGLPQNAIGAVLGFLAGFRRKKRKTEAEGEAGPQTP